MASEPWLIEIGENVTISGNVTFVTHDNSICKVDHSCPNLYGKIKIGDNCFIGQNSTVMYGVELPENVIVASGSVVVNSFRESNIIIGGNPAKKIGTWSDFLERNKTLALSKVNAKAVLENHPEMLIKRNVK